MTSRDGGETWTDRTRAAIITSSASPVAGYDPSALEIVVFATRNGGRSWAEQTLLSNVRIPETHPIAAFAAFDDDSIILVGTNPNSFALEGSHAFSFVTHDGGDTWTASELPDD